MLEHDNDIVIDGYVMTNITGIIRVLEYSSTIKTMNL